MLWNVAFGNSLNINYAGRSSNLYLYMAETKELDELSVNELHIFFKKLEEGVSDFNAYLKSY